MSAVLAVVAGTLFAVSGSAPARADVCGPGGSQIACENSKPGAPATAWDVSSSQGSTIQGFADPFSVNLGGTVHFKIQSAASSYKIEIYRMGYYGGDGARLITTITNPGIQVSQNQSACANNSANGLIDCSNWGVSASWTVPADLVSGVYFAHLVRTDGSADENQIPFVVRDDASHSGILFKTNDETWQAYNDWGGNSSYKGTASDTANSHLDAGRAELVSYDRPWATRYDNPYGQDYFFSAEFPMIEFMEKNGYDVSYVDQGTLGSSHGASLIEQHKILAAAGHDEYWSAPEVDNVTAARDAGVNLAFLTGNEVYWKTSFAADGAGEPGRTLVIYKESLDSAITDPNGPGTWTGSWVDPRFSPPSDGGRPQNALTGQLWTVNEGTAAITVPSQYAALRFWRNTAVAGLQAGQSETLTPETLGYEWDSDVDNGFRPSGLIDMSSTTVSAPGVMANYEQDLVSASTAHSLTLYRAASGALVFGAGTVQFAWGLNANHDGDAQPPVSKDMQQAIVNLFADMGNVQPSTLMSGLTAGAESTDTTAPASAITSPASGTALNSGATVTISGTATDGGGGVVAGVEISADGGKNWHPVTTMTAAATTVNWTYSWPATGAGTVSIQTRATDDSGNIESPSDATNVTVNCPCGLYSSDYVPSRPSVDDSTPLELGVKFTASVNGWIAGVKFYKGDGNTGTHTGSLWSASGTLLATGTFSNETAAGWQTLTFANPVPVAAGTVYIASYYDPNGHYAADNEQFYPGLYASAALRPLEATPLSAVRAGYQVGNGLYAVGADAFPSQTYDGTGYGVDVVFDVTQPTGSAPPTVVSATPYPGSSSNPVDTTPTVTFSTHIQPGSATFTVTDSDGTVGGSVSWNSTGTTATFTPSSPLPADSTVTVTVTGAKDDFGQTAAPSAYSFVTQRPTPPAGSCPCNIWSDAAVPPTVDSGDRSPNIELGVKFTPSTDGYITGIRFYKSLANTGTHTGTLWSSTGTKLATGTFTSESTTGWEQLDFATPVAVRAGTAYVASYFAPSGHYSMTPNGLNSAVTNGPLTALASAAAGGSGNGLYVYGSDSFPANSYNATNYWVDVVFAPNSSAPTVTGTTPLDGQTSVPDTPPVTFTFSKPVQAGSISFSLKDSNTNSVTGNLSYNSATSTATFTPAQPLSDGTKYTATVTAASDAGGNNLSAPYSWSFTTQSTSTAGQCPCSIWTNSTLPPIVDAADTNSVNLGIKFTAATDGHITGIRFYKGVQNVGTHVGTLWSATGTQLGQVTFTNESAAGWQEADFSTPIAVTAGTAYIASYLAPVGEYAVEGGGLSSAITSGPLATSVNGGVYAYSAATSFPTSVYNGNNYFVDVVFSTTSS